MNKYLVIYYDGYEYQAMFKESEYPDSMMAHTWGLSEECTIIAVIGAEQDLEGRVNVWIDEEKVIEHDG